MPSFNEMVVFGDSLSDNGNLYTALNELLPVSPPYFEGHFSNGPVWCEYLFASYLDTWNPGVIPYSRPTNFRNYAVGGAGATLHTKEELPYCLSEEITLYEVTHLFNNKDNSLFTLLIGANNYIKLPTNIDEITTDVIASIDNGLKRLIKMGAKHIIVINLPDLSKTPTIRVQGEDAVNLGQQLTQNHNAKLLVLIDNLRTSNPSINITHIDLFSMLNEIYEDATYYGISNVTAPIYGGDKFIDPLQGVNLTEILDYLDEATIQHALRISTVVKNAMSNNPILNNVFTSNMISSIGKLTSPGASPSSDGHLFWDGVHPTTEVHHFISNKIRTILDSYNYSYIK